MQITNNTAYDIVKSLKFSAQILEDALEQQNVESVADVSGLAKGFMNQVVGQFGTAFNITLDSAMAASSVIMLPETLTIKVGDTDVYVTAKTVPAGAGVPVFTVAPAGVVTVNSDGKVHAVAAGEATITATVDGKTDTCVVTVEAADIAVTGITTNFNTVELVGSMTDTTIIATIAPVDATNKGLVVTSSDLTTIDTVTVNELTGVVTAHSLNVTKAAFVSIATKDGAFTKIVKYNVTAS